MTELLEQIETDESPGSSESPEAVPVNPNENIIRLVGLGLLAITCITVLVFSQGWLSLKPSQNSEDTNADQVIPAGRPRTYNNNQSVEPPQRRLMPRGRSRVDSRLNEPGASTMSPTATPISR